MPADLALFKPTAAELKVFPREREIRNSIQKKILGGRLPAGAALPSMKTIATLWKSNYFTVYQALTPLVREGLLVRQKGLGTRVASTRRKLQTVGVYYGADIISKPQHGYAVQLHRQLHRVLAREGLKMRTWLEPREREESLGEVLPDIVWAVDHQLIQGIIAPMTSAEQLPQFDRLGVPVVYFGHGAGERRVHFPRREFLTRALRLAAESGARTVAVIASPEVHATDGRERTRSPAQAFSVFSNLCKAQGLATDDRWFHLINSGSLTPEREREQIAAAYEGLLQGRGRRPDALIVHPDNNLATLHALLVGQGRRFDENLVVISHRNEPPAFPLPRGPRYVALSLESTAEGLVHALTDCAEGRTPAGGAAELVESDSPGAALD